MQNPEQVIDILALMGDASDNIPGAPGVGPKTAMKLVSEYGSIEELFRNTSALKGKLKETIENNREQIEMSKKLSTIEQNVPVDLNEEELEKEIPDNEKLKDLFDELEFRTVASRILQSIADQGNTPQKKEMHETDAGSVTQGTLFGSEVKVPEKTSANTVEHNYLLIESETELQSLAERLSSLQEFCFDTETTSIDPLESQIVALAFYWAKGEGYLIPFPESQEKQPKHSKSFGRLLKTRH